MATQASTAAVAASAVARGGARTRPARRGAAAQCDSGRQARMAAMVCAWPRAGFRAGLRPAAAAAGLFASGRAPHDPLAATAVLEFLSHRWRSYSSVGVEDVRSGQSLSYWHEPGKEPLMALTVGQVAELAARRWPDREALVSLHQGHRLTFQDTLNQADKFAAALIGLGMKPGDMLGLCGPNSSEWYITNLAAARAGLILVNINPAYQAAELEYCLTKVGVKALVMSETFKTQNYIKMVESIAPEISSCQSGKINSKKLPYLKSLITICSKEIPGTFRYENLIQSVTSSDVSQVHKLQAEIQTDAGCNLQFTSGTTGLPKGTLLTHHNVVNNAYFAAKRLGYHHKHHRICLPVPFFHCFGNVLGVIIGLHSGSTLVLPSYSFRAEDTINAIVKESCTAIYGTPTMYIDIISKSQSNSVKISSLDFAITAGSPTPPHLFNDITKKLSLKNCYSVYGMTETSPLSFVPDYDDTVDQCSNTVGRVLDHVEVKVVDSENRMVPMGQPGELLVRGYGNMLCYYNDTEKTKEIVGQDRWLRTGDQFVLHKDGYGEVVGRIKDMIIRGGENIFPKEIEEYLITHKDIVDAQVLGVPDERLGEEICACIRLKPGSQLTVNEIKDYCKGKIAHFKIPKYIELMDDYPRTQSGKVQKFKLRDLILAERLNPS